MLTQCLIITSNAMGGFTLEATAAAHPSAHPSVSGMLNVRIAHVDAGAHLIDSCLVAVRGEDASSRPYSVSMLPPMVDGVVNIPLLGLAAGEKHTLTVVVEGRVRMRDGFERVERASVVGSVFPTDPAAHGIPTITTLVADATRMAPGWTWWSNFAAGNNSYWAGSIMTDEEGTTRFVADCATAFASWWPAVLKESYGCAMTGTQSMLANGNLAMMWTIENGMVAKTGLTGLVEIAPNGTTLHCWVATRGMPAWQLNLIPASPAPVNGSRVHTVTVAWLDAFVINHDVQELSNGNWMAIAFEDREVVCPRWGKDSGRNVTGNELVEFAPYARVTAAGATVRAGQVMKRFSLFDALDACETFDVSSFDVKPALEWLHLNSFDVHNTALAALAGPQALLNELIVSSFYLGWVVAIRYADDAGGKAGSLKWIMGAPQSVPPTLAPWWAKQAHFTLAGATQSDAAEVAVGTPPLPLGGWQQSQHNVNVVHAAGVANGSILLMFDNGANALRSTNLVDSRLVSFTIDARPRVAANGTVLAMGKASVKWSWENDFARISPVVGGSVQLANGNVLGCWGSVTDPPASFPTNYDTKTVCMHAHVVEVVPATGAGGRDRVVWSATVGGHQSGVCFAWNAYRALRVSNPFRRAAALSLARSA